MLTDGGQMILHCHDRRSEVDLEVWSTTALRLPEDIGLMHTDTHPLTNVLISSFNPSQT